FTAVFSHGNEIISETPLTVDSIGPAIRTTIHPPIFSPDGDGDNDTLFVGTDIDDTSGVEDWKISVLPLVDDKLGTNAFKTWKGKNAYRELITWDGYGDEAPAGSKDDKYLVESASDYAIVVTAKDKLGNTITTKPELFKVDILVIRTPYGYKIRISSIQFDYNSADVKAKYEPILTRLAQVLNKFKQHAVKIEGHTDMVGPDKYNNELSLKRASSVLSYLVERGLERKRFTAEGVGKQRPLFEEKADDPVLEEHRARNRRVEFYLKK
ncbi:MAG: OmpA family protein, partial [Spirochaetota bacterium]